MAKELEEQEVESEEDDDNDFGEEEESSEPSIKVPDDFYRAEMHKLKNNPLEYIGTWMEENLLHVGRRAFKVIALMPCSEIIPSIPFLSTDIRSNINTFLIGSPATGKSTITKKFLNLSYSPIRVKGISAKKLMDKIFQRDGMFSLGIDDFSNVLDQPDGYETIKILEGALGDEKTASHENMKYSKICRTQAVGLICGTWVDLKKYSNYLKGGLLSRMSLLFISLTNKQREEIADFINDGVGKVSRSNESRMKEVVIKDYYKTLFDIQAKNNKQIAQISGYYFDPNYKSMALYTWKRLTREYANDINGDFKREFHDFYRYLVSHAFLNVFKREVKNGVLYPIKEDYDFALGLMEETLKNKIALIQSSIFVKQIDSPAKLLKVLNNPLKEDVKNIILNLSPYGKIVSNMQGKIENKGNVTIKK